MRKSKFLAAILTIGIVSGAGYMMGQPTKVMGQEITKEVETQEESKIEDEVNFVEDKIITANEDFAANGMIDIYSNLRRGKKKKWTKLINENNYFGDETATYEISSIYELGDDQYYILGYSLDEEDAPNEIFQLILSEENGNYFTTKAIYPSKQVLTSDEVATYKKETQAESNVDIEYNRVHNLDDVDEYIDYLDQAISDMKEDSEVASQVINDAGKKDVTQYVQYAIENLATTKAIANENTIDISTSVINEMKESMVDAKDKFNELLDKNNISFNKDLNTVLKLQTEAANFKKPIYIKLPSEPYDLDEVTGLKVVIDDNSYVYINKEDLEALAGYTIKIERLSDKKSYEITFLNPSGEELEQVEQTITFAFKAKDEFTTVVMVKDEEEQNWGGQYESGTKSISFGTKYSGTYKVVDNNVKIKDISHLTSKQQAAIRFMVSKGYLTLENDSFNPNHTFTRYEFAQALVKMFFALDTSLEASFSDVSKDSLYYPYVASGETYEIIKGFADGTFKGDTNILKEQVISLCARTIADQKGYVYPEYREDYLKFADIDEIGNWALDDIALAVQSGLTTAGGSLEPKSEITKAESAEVLYELFNLLYETTPDNVMEMTVEQKTYSILGIIAALAIALGLVWKIIKRFQMMLTMMLCTAAIIITLIIGFKGGF